MKRGIALLGWMLMACGGASGLDGGGSAAPDDAETAQPDAGAGAVDGGPLEGDAGPGRTDAGPAADSGPSIPTDPFAPQPDESEGLTNVSADLEALLENGALPGACAAYEAAPNDRRAMLLCGKYMFFYEHFDTVGVPAPLIDFLSENFPNEVGPGFSQMGMIADPLDPKARPLGLAPGTRGGDVESLVWTCAACHFGELPDGRYAVGAPNLDYDYSKQILAITLVPGSVAPGFDPSAHAPAALAKVQPMLDTLAADRALRIRLLLNLLPLIGADQPMFTVELEEQYASWPPGTMDFLISPLPLDDGVHTVSKIIDLWGLPRAEEQGRAGMPTGLLAWTGGAPNLQGFLEGFVKVGGGPVDEWPAERLRPLAEYIYSLRAPAIATAPPADQVASGRALFDADCAACHGAPRGGGDRVFTYEEMGTDDAMRAWGNPDADGRLCCGLASSDDPRATFGVKSPRLAGVWAKPRLLHNGAVQGLPALFCLDGPRPTSSAHALGAQGHEDLCEDYDEAEKRALIAWLRSI